MLQLFIDTAEKVGIVGLGFDGELIEAIVMREGENSKTLFPTLLDLLAKHSYTPKDLQLIGAGIGPGSYTGIRVGAAASQSISYALRLPLVSLSSLECYFPSRTGSFCAVMDARWGGVYVQEGIRDEGGVRFEQAPIVATFPELQERVKDIHQIVIPKGEGFSEKLKELFPEKIIEECLPSGALFAKRVHEKYLAGDYTLKADLKLLYLRKTQAEIEREQSAS